MLMILLLLLGGTPMSNLSSEEIQNSIESMKRLVERAKNDPGLRERLLAGIHERPQPHPLTPIERCERLMQQARVERSRANGSPSH